MKKPNFLKKFTLIDYLIIIIVIATILFAFTYITSDNQDKIQSTSYDSSTLNKIVENYLSFYREGKVVETTVNGYNASTGEEIELHGIIKWMDDNRGSNVKILIESDGKDYLAGLYEDIPYADIYINKISLETSGKTYQNLTEVTISPQNITSLNDLTKGIGNNSNYEISTTIMIDSHDGATYQKILNTLFDLNKRISIKASNANIQDELTVTRATSEEITSANNILGQINGITGEIKIMIYNCTPKDLDSIKNNYNVTNIREVAV